MHINGVGSSIPTARELDSQTMVDASLFVDRRESTLNEAGDFLIPQREGLIGPDHIRAELGELLLGTAEGRRSDDEITLFKSLGIGVEDLAAGELVLAARRGGGCGDGRLAVIPLDEIRRAREVLDGVAVRTPLVRLDADTDAEIWLKLELLQPVRSFKIRGAGSAVLQATDEELAGGVLTASAGNMAQGLSYVARRRGLTATIVVPDHAPQTKIDAIERYGGRVIKVPYDEWWNTMVTGGYPGVDGLFVHPVADDRVMAGNGTIGLELVEQLDDFDAVVVPYGGGGLVTGIASAVKALRPEVRFYSSEPATGAPVAATFAAGGTPTGVEYQPSFVDGSGSRELIPRVWEHASQLLDGAFAPSLDDVAAAVRLMAERTRVIPEGAGALALAAALNNDVGRKVVCVVSGGNIDLSVLARILNGETP